MSFLRSKIILFTIEDNPNRRFVNLTDWCPPKLAQGQFNSIRIEKCSKRFQILILPKSILCLWGEYLFNVWKVHSDDQTNSRLSWGWGWNWGWGCQQRTASNETSSTQTDSVIKTFFCEKGIRWVPSELKPWQNLMEWKKSSFCTAQMSSNLDFPCSHELNRSSDWMD